MKTPTRKPRPKTPSIEKVISGRRAVGSPKRRGTEIINTAADIFAERGYHGASTQDIADRVGIRQASLYYYIPSKDVALEQICMIGIGDMVEGAETIAEMKVPQVEMIRLIISRHLSAVYERRSFMRVFLRERQNLPDASRRQVSRLARQYEEVVQRIIETGVKSGEFRSDIDPRLTTLTILGVCNSASGWRDKELTADMEGVTQGITSLVVCGLLAVQKPKATGAVRKTRVTPPNK